MAISLKLQLNQHQDFQGGNYPKSFTDMHPKSHKLENMDLKT
jgi:hypothetical protein